MWIYCHEAYENFYVLFKHVLDVMVATLNGLMVI